MEVLWLSFHYLKENFLNLKTLSPRIYIGSTLYLWKILSNSCLKCVIFTTEGADSTKYVKKKIFYPEELPGIGLRFFYSSISAISLRRKPKSIPIKLISKSGTVWGETFRLSYWHFAVASTIILSLHDFMWLGTGWSGKYQVL